jgi:hypothetical protein
MVHKVVKKIDADKLLLDGDVKMLEGNLESHNKELKTIYSTSEKNKFKKEFEYAQKYRNRIEFNPKDAEELKEHYKKEQKKISSSNKMIEELIDTLVEQNELTKDQVEELNKELTNNKDAIIEDLHSELKKELGADYDKVMNAIQVEDDEEEDIKVEEKSNKKNKVKEVKEKEVKEETDNETDINIRYVAHYDFEDNEAKEIYTKFIQTLGSNDKILNLNASFEREIKRLEESNQPIHYVSKPSFIQTRMSNTNTKVQLFQEFKFKRNLIYLKQTNFSNYVK